MASPEVIPRMYSAQGSVEIRRIKNGDSLFLTFRNAGKPLYQCVDTDSGVVSPDWSGTAADKDPNNANRPVIIPEVTSSLGLPVSVVSPEWTYGNKKLAFSGSANSDGWITGDADGQSDSFAFNPHTNAIKPVKNLASKTQYSNMTLHFGCHALVDGVRYHICKDITVYLTLYGESGYIGFIMADPGLTLDEDTSLITLSTVLYCNGAEVPDYHVTWRKNQTEWKAKSGSKSVAVTRSDVDGTQLFVASFALTPTGSQVAVAGVTVVDRADSFFVRFRFLSANDFIDDCNSSCRVQAFLINRKGVEQTGTKYWRLDVVDQEDYASLKSVDGSDTIEVTTDQTDRRKKMPDGSFVTRCGNVDVWANVSFGLNFTLTQVDLQVNLQPIEYRARATADYLANNVALSSLAN